MSHIDDKIIEAFDEFMAARTKLLNLGAEKVRESGGRPSLANIWLDVLEVCRGDDAGEQASHLVAGLNGLASEWLDNVLARHES